LEDVVVCDVDGLVHFSKLQFESAVAVSGRGRQCVVFLEFCPFRNGEGPTRCQRRGRRLALSARKAQEYFISIIMPILYIDSLLRQMILATNSNYLELSMVFLLPRNPVVLY
jgi:hypothetical protein